MLFDDVLRARKRPPAILVTITRLFSVVPRKLKLNKMYGVLNYSYCPFMCLHFLFKEKLVFSYVFTEKEAPFYMKNIQFKNVFTSTLILTSAVFYVNSKKHKKIIPFSIQGQCFGHVDTNFGSAVFPDKSGGSLGNLLGWTSPCAVSKCSTRAQLVVRLFLAFLETHLEKQVLNVEVWENLDISLQKNLQVNSLSLNAR